MLWVSCGVILLAGVVAAHEIWILLEFDLRYGLQHLMLRLGALATASHGTREVLRARLVAILHNLRDFFPNAVGLLHVGRDLHIVRFVILFFSGSTTYKFSMLLVMTVRSTHRLAYTRR